MKSMATPSCCRVRLSKSSTYPRTETSSAEVILVADKSLGPRPLSARATATRWRSPPGKLKSGAPGGRYELERPKQLERRMHPRRSRRCYRLNPAIVTAGAPLTVPAYAMTRVPATRRGSWKTIWIRRRTRRPVDAHSLRRGKWAPVQEDLEPTVGACRPAMQRAIVVLPPPDLDRRVPRTRPYLSGERDVVGGDHLASWRLRWPAEERRLSRIATSRYSGGLAQALFSEALRRAAFRRFTGSSAQCRLSSISVGPGIASPDSVTTCAQRGAKGQPDGHSPTAAAVPASPPSRSAIFGSGTDSTRPRV